MSKAKKKVTIGMYNVGLGDCFLVRFPDEERERRVLIDCGVHASGPGPYKMDQVVERIVGDVTDDDGVPRIDVVVATHRHRDHVLGFESERWADVEVGEVWMPWTEHPTDPDARKIREKQSKKALQIQHALMAMNAAPELLEMVDNSLTNAKAMTTLHDGFAGKPKRRFLPPERRSRQTFTTRVLPGVNVHAMGPSRDPEVIRDMDPPKGGAFELRLGMTAKTKDGAAPESTLFGKSFHVPVDEAALRLFSIGERDLKVIEHLADLDPFSVAVQIDKAVNGTSLLLMFEIGRAHLLFPGDAQWGTWQNALADDEWHDLLAKTNFLKVGHHGSHNATPKAFVTDILEKHKFTAMICTRETKVFKKIPLQSLVTELNARSGNRVARSDDTGAVKGFKRKDDAYTATTVDI